MPVSESSLGSGLESGLESGVAAFFRSYERVSASGDVAALAAQFAEVFLVGGPQGSKCVRAADFALALPKRKELFDSMGRTESKLVGLEATALDTRYTLARTRWSMRIAGEGKEAREVVLESTFLVDMGGEEPRILMYLAHQDAVAVVKREVGAQA